MSFFSKRNLLLSTSILAFIAVISINKHKNVFIKTFEIKKGHKVTVVSMYFSLNKSKHSLNEYDTWIQNFLKSVGSPLALFCDTQSLNKLKIYRGNKLVKFYVYESVWDVMRVLESYRNMSYVDNYLNKQLHLDREKHIHNPNLYAIWNLKTFILKLVADENHFKSEYFIYTDAGAWRERIFENWPDENFIGRLVKYQQNRILFGQISDNLSDLERNDIIEGTFFSGTKEAINNLYSNYYSIHDRRFQSSLFVGKDQIIMNLLTFREYNESVIKLRTWGIKCNISFNPWFFYQYFFAKENEYKCSENKISLLN